MLKEVALSPPTGAQWRLPEAEPRTSVAVIGEAPPGAETTLPPAGTLGPVVWERDWPGGPGACERPQAAAFPRYPEHHVVPGVDPEPPRQPAWKNHPNPDASK